MKKNSLIQEVKRMTKERLEVHHMYTNPLKIRVINKMTRRKKKEEK